MTEKNHYIPIFYQKRWAADDGTVCPYSRPFKQARARRVHPAGNGYQKGLYMVPGVDPIVANYLERHFFKVTDDTGAEALSILEKGQWEPMDSRVRSGWNSLRDVPTAPDARGDPALLRFGRETH